MSRPESRSRSTICSAVLLGANRTPLRFATRPIAQASPTASRAAAAEPTAPEAEPTVAPDHDDEDAIIGDRRHPLRFRWQTDREGRFSIELAKENVRLDERRLRLRHMEIQPGGIVPLHDHADRPALIMVNSGEIYENSSKCAVPIFHKAGDISREFLGVKHWWKNEGNVVVVLTIADIVNDKKPDTMMKNM